MTQYNLNGTRGGGRRCRSKGLLEVIDNAIEIDFGAGGIGGNPGTTAADGYYALTFTPPGGQPGVGSTHHFYRLLGDVNGDGTVDQNDLNEIAAARGQSVSQIADGDQPAGVGPDAPEHGRQRRRLGQHDGPAAGDEVQGQFAEERTAPGMRRSPVAGIKPGGEPPREPSHRSPDPRLAPDALLTMVFRQGPSISSENVQS